MGFCAYRCLYKRSFPSVAFSYEEPLRVSHLFFCCICSFSCAFFLGSLKVFGDRIIALCKEKCRTLSKHYCLKGKVDFYVFFLNLDHSSKQSSLLKSRSLESGINWPIVVFTGCVKVVHDI